MAQNRVIRRLAAVLTADMVGYSKLMQLDEAGTVARQSAFLGELVAPCIERFGGRLVKTTGDGFLAEFSSAVDALGCAAEFQQEMVSREIDVPTDRQIVYRVGINIGEIIYENGDIFGDGVNIAARLEALSDPGGITVSQAVFDNVKGKLDLGFANLGAKKLKNIAQPILTYRVLLDAADAGKVVSEVPRISRRGLILVAALIAFFAIFVAGYFYTAQQVPTSANSPKRLLVLPYQGLDRESEIYAEAVSENLWLSLPRIKGFTMVPRPGSLELEGVIPTREQILAHGDVTHVLGGTVATEGDQLTIKTLLRAVDEESGSEATELEAYSAPEELFAKLAEQKLELVSALNVPLHPQERMVVVRRPTENVQAYLLYAEAQNAWMTGEIAGIKSALALLEQAIEIEPQFFDARGSYAYLNYYVWYMGMNPVRNNLDAHNTAVATAARLLEDDPLNSDALFVQSAIMLHTDRERALTMARGAIFQKREDPSLRRVLGWALLSNNLHKEARAEFETYLELSPRLTAEETLDITNAFLRLDEPARASEILYQFDPEALTGLSALVTQAEMYSRLGKLDKGQEYARQFLQFLPFYSVMWDEPKFRTYKDPSVFQRYSEALQNVGVPLWPLDFDNGREADRLDEEALLKLFARSFKTIDTTDPVGGPYTSQYNSDGTVSLQYGFLPEIKFQGMWKIDGDEICQEFPAISMGLRVCERVYLDRDASTPEAPRYIQLNGFGLHKFGIQYTGD